MKDQELFKRKLPEKLADYDQTYALIRENLLQSMRQDPSMMLGLWTSLMEEGSQQKFDDPITAVCFWLGIIECRKLMFSLIDEYGEWDDKGDVSFK